MKYIVKIISSVLAAFVLSIVGTIVVAVATSQSPGMSAYLGSTSFYSLWLTGFFLSLISQTNAIGWGRVLVVCGFLSFAAPLATLFMAADMIGNVVDEVPDSGEMVVGAALGGGALIGAAWIFGFMIGVLFIFLGLVIGRKK